MYVNHYINVHCRLYVCKSVRRERCKVTDHDSYQRQSVKLRVRFHTSRPHSPTLDLASVLLSHNHFRCQPQSSRITCDTAYLFNTVYYMNKPPSISICLVDFYGHFKSPHSFHISSLAHLYIIIIV